MSEPQKLSKVEGLKASSQGLRGDLAEELANPQRGGISEDAYNLLKFHGSYEQFDRDTATVRKQAGQDKEWQFMVRVRAPGGRMTASQYLALDDVAGRYANGTLRITVRQGIQFHGVRQGDLEPHIAAINHALMTTYAACGDVVRNVMSTPAPRRDALHARLDADSAMLSNALLPQSRAYYQIFLGEEETPLVPEPLYGPTYLPRKFKIGLAHPADNTIDVLSNDLGFIALTEGDTLLGYQVAVGGGLGMTHNKPRTYPRLATIIGFVGPDDLRRAADAVISLQRDNGDRGDRRRARLKYVVDDKGVDWVKRELTTTYGLDLQSPRDMPKLEVPELLGWHQQGDGRLWLGVPIPSGRIQDGIRNALREVAERFAADPVFTPQQDVLLSNIDPANRDAVEAVFRAHGVALADTLSPLSIWTLACPALPTCGLALTEAERVREPIIADIEAALDRHGLAGERISLRITGCPNGCTRPYTGDIGLVGRVPGQYAIFVGGDFEGTRLSFKLIEKVPMADLGRTLEPLFAGFAADRQTGEGFGDFCNRQGVDALLSLMPRAMAVAAE